LRFLRVLLLLAFMRSIMGKAHLMSAPCPRRSAAAAPGCCTAPACNP
jgi:hypothetical protein